MKKLTKKQLDSLKEIIDGQLELRCINVKTTLIQKTGETSNPLDLTSTKFQTIPVIHKNLSIINFGGNIVEDKENKNILNIYIPVHINYEGNGVVLFSVHAYINSDDKNNAYVNKITHY